MEEIMPLFERQRRLLDEFGTLLGQLANDMVKGLPTDPSIRHALDPNNEYVKYSNPVTWEDLGQMGDRSNFFVRTFRFKYECVMGS
jgi:hypothetical protein